MPQPQTNTNDVKILLYLRQEPDSICFLFQDAGGLAIRSLHARPSGEWKSHTIPVTKTELKHLADFIQEQLQ